MFLGNKMNYIFRKIIKEISKKINNKKGLEVFAIHRAKFEGWLKVEICDILLSFTQEVKVEYGKNGKKIDIFFKYNKCGYYIELKTINTSYKCNYVVRKNKPITNNLESVINDINKLKNLKNGNKYIFFIVFLLPKNKVQSFEDNINFKEIESNVNKIESFNGKFSNNVPFKIYIGEI
ncbi:hypothetical protein CMTB2_03803 [Caminibacter mediatlanticus TB-2]|uniref:Uncharacterized protein n=2 Tax=Caminibacter mediatlanticus TaxID=291048 RepID=A0AAI9AJB1_9BACT|nr:hypothetical protein CMTB2_03803 [Caminibacter mediatlanticus TB-2]